MTSTSGIMIIRLFTLVSSVFLIRQPNKGDILVDSGVPKARGKLISALKYHNVNPEYLILTHSHYDHAGNAAFIKQTTGAKVIIHEAEAEYLHHGKMNYPSGTFPLTRFIINLARTRNYDMDYEPCQADIIISKDGSLSGHEDIKLIHTPGHSAGSLSVVVNDEIVVAGDTMVNNLLFKLFPPFADDPGMLMHTWEKLLATGCHTFIPSHGRLVDKELLAQVHEKLRNKYIS